MIPYRKQEKARNTPKFAQPRFKSIRIIEQAFQKIPDGPINADAPHVVLPSKQETYQTMEGLIYHFKLIVEGVKVPPGEVYSYTEVANGELGFYIVSDGSGRPYKCRVRPPLLCDHAGAFPVDQRKIFGRCDPNVWFDQHDRR